VGEATAKLLAKRYRTFETWHQAMLLARQPDSEAWNELRTIESIGPLIARDIVEFFNEAHNRKALDDLAKELIIEVVSIPTASLSPLAGKTVVFTGTLIAMGRSEAKAKAEKLGANVSGTVSAKTDFVVVGEDAGSKAKKAHALGLKVLTESEWLSLVGGNP
jgi:DNA ligase (NAD+)